MREVDQDVPMIVLVMVMGINIKNIGKIIFFPILTILVILTACKKNDYPKQNINASIKQKQDSLKIAINVIFNDPGVFALNTLVNQRNFTFNLTGKKKNDSQIKVLSVIKPTVFESYRLINNKTYIRRYFAFGSDTLNFNFRKDSTIYSGNKKNNIINTLVNDNDVFSVYSKADTPNYTDEYKRKYEDNLTKLKQESNQFSSDQYKSITEYLRLYFYDKIFNIDFSKKTHPEIIKKLDVYYQEIFDNVSLLDEINTISSKRLVYNLLRFVAFKNNKTNLIESLDLLDKRLYKTQAFEGFLLDYTESLSNSLTIKDKENIQKYISGDKLNNLYLNKTQKLPTSLLSSNLQSITKSSTLKEIFQVNKKSLILIDLWATWCIPCLNEMPAWNEMQKKFGKNVTFLRFSIDKDKKKWEQYLKSKGGEEELNYIMTSPTHPFIKWFKIDLIPRYILLDSNYNILSDDFIRPSDPSFSNQLQKYMK